MNRYFLSCVSALALVAVAPAFAEEHTIIHTSTTEPAYVVPSASRTVIINPATKKIVRAYEAAVQVPVGYYVAEADTGKVLAVSREDGTLVAYTASDFAVRRALI